jgi:3D (Asp-Asp-Asp) domain-containing protein
MRRAIILALLWTTLSGVAAADVGQGRCWQLRPAERTMLAFGYTSGPESTGKAPEHPAYGLTARGTRARYGVCAADPMIPFGTRLWVEGYGLAIVEDRGGAIRGDRLDLWFGDVTTALKWGRKTVRVVVLND